MHISEDAEGRRSAAVSFAADFSSALLNPKTETPAGVMGPNETTAVKRYNVYRNNVTVSLIDALAAIYPGVQRIAGAECFRAMARLHVRASPPTSPLLFEYGRDFPEFIKHCEYVRSVPWLSDIARTERAWLDAYHAADAESPHSACTRRHTREECFQIQSSCRILRPGSFGLIIPPSRFSSQLGPKDLSGTADSVAPEDGLITRPEREVVVRRLPVGAAKFLTVLTSGEPLGAAASEALESCASFDLPANIASMIEAGVFTAVQFGDRDDND